MISPLSWLGAGGFSFSASVISLWGYNEVSEGFAEWFFAWHCFLPSLVILAEVLSFNPLLGFVCLARWVEVQGNSPGMISSKCDPLSPLAATTVPQTQEPAARRANMLPPAHGKVPLWASQVEISLMVWPETVSHWSSSENVEIKCTI